MLNMGAVLLLLIGVTDGVKTFCDTTQCFGSLGGTLEVQMPTQSSRVIYYRVWKNNVEMGSSDPQRIDNPRYSFNVDTGILTMEDLNRSDSGEYTTTVYSSPGVISLIFYVSIQAPVSSPLLSRECLSRGQQRVSCSAGGDGLHYSWSLDGPPLNATRLLSGPSNASDVTLEPGRAGLITCWVNNNVSATVANLTLSVCQDLIPIVARSLTVVVLLLVALGVYWALKKKKTPRPQDIPLSSMAGDDDGLYVNVSRATGGAGGE